MSTANDYPRVNERGETVWACCESTIGPVCHHRAIVDCGHEAIATGVGTGYAVTADGKRVCYACADEMQRAEMVTADRFGAYLSTDGRTVTTWTGGHLARVTSASVARNLTTPTGGHYERYTVHAVDATGKQWIGTGPSRGMFLRLRAAKV